MGEYLTRRGRVFLAFLAGAASLAAPTAASAAVSLDLLGSTGQAYQGFGIRAKSDLPDLESAGDDEAGSIEWRAEGAYSYLEAYNMTPTRVGEAAAAIERVQDGIWRVRAGARGARDEISTLQFAGPTLDLSYFWLDSDPKRPHVLDVSVGAEILFYRTDAVIPGRPAVIKGQTVQIASSNGRKKDSEFDPYISIAKPFAGGAVTPRLYACHHSYSSSPDVIEKFAGRPRLSADPDRVGSLVGGFFRDDGKATLALRLSEGIGLEGSLGAARSQTDGKWAVLQEGALRMTPSDHLRFRAAWRRAVQYALHVDTVSGDLAFTW